MKSEDERKWFDFHGIQPELAELYRYFDRTVLCYRINKDIRTCKLCCFWIRYRLCRCNSTCADTDQVYKGPDRR